MKRDCDTSHKVIEDWMGGRIETLADLLRAELSAVCVGINPVPKSVQAGHYYQGTLGQLFFSRLREAGLLSRDCDGWEDDAAFTSGIGFTDIVKRPTRKATEIRADEFVHGLPVLRRKLEHFKPKMIIFTFKKAAVKYFGQFDGNGFVKGLCVGETPVFVMPGPYELGATVRQRLKELSAKFVQVQADEASEAK